MSDADRASMSSIVQGMLDAHPAGDVGRSQIALIDFLDACLACAQACGMCADACLSEDMVGDLRRCIRLDGDCAEICATTVRVLSRRSVGADSPTIRALVDACRLACRACAAECESHAEHHEHCRICAEACRRCETACDALLDVIG